MSVNYKKLGEIVKLIDERNKDEKVQTLIGVSIEKCFIKSVANTIGTDLSKYQIIRKNDFACSLMQVSRDGKIPIACLKDYDEAIMSPAYYIFRIKNTDEVLPDYLSMWFMRSEFDREAAYIAVGGVRGSMPWEDFCNMELPIPDIKEQQKIVDAYNSITKRIKIKQKINENLEKTAQCLFDKNFKEYNKFYEKEDLKTLPADWKYAIVGDFCKDNIKSISSSNELKEILYLDTGSITNNKIDDLQTISERDGFPSRAKRMIYDNDIVFSTVRPNLRHFGIIRKPAKNMIVSTGFSVLHNNSDRVSNEFLYMWITNDATLSFLQSIAENSVSTYPSINADDIMNIKIIIPTDNILSELNEVFRKTFLMIDYNNQEITKMQELKQLVISRISGM
ncbi:MAG: restriction endonuclease subunit S [Treponema sp.]|nr:restriction endonuclease subunit S [Treponema sp.]